MNKSIKTSMYILLIGAAMPIFGHECCEVNPLIKEQFKKLDINGDGFISKAEVEAQPDYTKYMEVSNWGGFDMADINSDGLLNFDEFLANEVEKLRL